MSPAGRAGVVARLATLRRDAVRTGRTRRLLFSCLCTADTLRAPRAVRLPKNP
jgi:hypothetical protein